MTWLRGVDHRRGAGHTRALPAGLTVIGGTLADRFSYKPVILIGLAVRASGFAMMGLAETFPTVLAAAVLSGLGGSIFASALCAYLAGGEGTARRGVCTEPRVQSGWDAARPAGGPSVAGREL